MNEHLDEVDNFENIVAMSYTYRPDSLMWDTLHVVKLAWGVNACVHITLTNEGRNGDVTEAFLDRLREYTKDKLVVTAFDLYGGTPNVHRWASKECLRCEELLDISNLLWSSPIDAHGLMLAFEDLLMQHSLPSIRELVSYNRRKIDSTGVFEFRGEIPYCTKGIYSNRQMRDIPEEYYRAMYESKNLPEELRAIAKRALVCVYPVRGLKK